LILALLDIVDVGLALNTYINGARIFIPMVGSQATRPGSTVFGWSRSTKSNSANFSRVGCAVRLE